MSSIPGCQRSFERWPVSTAMQLSALLVYAVALGATPTLTAPQPCRTCSSAETGPGTTAHVIGFVVNYKTSASPISGINGTLFTEIVYQTFAIANGICVVENPLVDTQQAFGGNALGNDTNAEPFKGNFYQLRLLKQQPGNAGRLRTLISVGGWTYSTNLSVIASSSAGRRQLASSCTQLARYYGFDGIELRWEYPVMGGASTGVYSQADKENMPLLLAEFRSQDPGLLLTTNAWYTEDVLFPMYDLAAIANQVDWIHADMSGLWPGGSSSTAHYANLYYNLASPSSETVDGLVVAALAAGVPPCKFILGVPLSYPAWRTSSSSAYNFPALFTTGQPYLTGTDAGLYRYRDAMQLYGGGSGSYRIVLDGNSSASVLYGRTSRVWIPIETVQSVTAKADYISAKSLGGASFTDLSGDTTTFQLVTAMQSALKRSSPCNGQPAPAPSGDAVPGYERQAPGACEPVSNTPGVAPALQTATRVIGRYTNYKGQVLPVAGINGSLLTHIIYESAMTNASFQCLPSSAYLDTLQVFGSNALGDDSGDPYHGNFNQLRRLKLKYPHLKTILQLGPSVMYSSMLSVPARQAVFVSSCIAMMQQYGFDGLNIKWENPILGSSYMNDPHLPTDRTQLPVLMGLLRSQMPAGALLTLTIDAIASDVYVMYDMPGIVPYADFIEFKNEWMWGTWSHNPAHLNPLHFNTNSNERFSIEASIVQLLNWGVPHCKLVLGVAVYGVAWQLSAPVSKPFYPNAFVAYGSGYTAGSSDEGGHYRYRDVQALMRASPGAWVDYWDPVSQSSLLYNATGNVVISYENPASIAAKAAYVKSMALGGFAIDDLDGDTMDFALLYNAVLALSSRARSTTKIRQATKVSATTATPGLIPRSILILSKWDAKNNFRTEVYDSGSVDGLSIPGFIASTHWRTDDSLEDNLDRFVRYRTTRWYSWARIHQPGSDVFRGPGQTSEPGWR
ncbi:unnamed protein product (mitochondrion) [Plasmodiophora brassicae]|uniref:GH18 domain-containing protein n=1 Tax=Plasmodiophora brassicae TaxID=37360 RepID=A0A3P3YJ46_PLABS|nr:unnamed protein product [Plasmodiophora brassicae]